MLPLAAVIFAFVGADALAVAAPPPLNIGAADGACVLNEETEEVEEAEEELSHWPSATTISDTSGGRVELTIEEIVSFRT